MGLLQFVKALGSGKINPTEIEEKVKNDLGSQIIEIKAEVNGDELTLSGICESNDAREKAALIAGNTKGVGRLNYFGLKVKKVELKEQPAAAPEVKQMPAEQAESSGDTEEVKTEETEFYTIVSGDTLSKIAKKYYGDANKYHLLFEANREVIKHPDKIYVGQMIRIPKI